MSALVGVRVTIRQLSGNGWLVTWHDDGREAAVPTAAEALARVKKFGELMAEQGISTAVTIEWEPCNAVGRAVVRALTS